MQVGDAAVVVGAVEVVEGREVDAHKVEAVCWETDQKSV